MNVIVTGAAGFIGQALASCLLAGSYNIAHLTLTDVVEPPQPRAPASSHTKVTFVKADLISLADCKQLFTPDVHVAYLLHGLMSGAAEANLELGIRLNMDSMRQVLDIMRGHGNPAVKVVFPSSLAVYGPNTIGKVVSEETVPLPQSSYGAEKFITETLLNDYSRRGLVDGRILRLPTVVVRPGVASGAASSFASGIIREPLKAEKTILLVRKDLEMWVCWVRVVVKNLVVAMAIPKEKYAERHSRTVNLPGITVTVKQMLEGLEKVGGEKALELVEEKRDSAVEKIMESWPVRFDTAVAKSMGFVDDVPFAEAVQAFLEDYGTQGRDRISNSV